MLRAGIDAPVHRYVHALWWRAGSAARLTMVTEGARGGLPNALDNWVSWMWMFGTPFYWLIAPIVRRMRCLTLADYFQERFGKAASALYIVVASAGMIVCLASVLLATARTAQAVSRPTSGVPCPLVRLSRKCLHAIPGCSHFQERRKRCSHQRNIGRISFPSPSPSGRAGMY